MAGFEKQAEVLRAFALSLPGAEEAFPWGERVVKVNKKVFAFLGVDANRDRALYLGVKLADSADDAHDLPFAEPMGYGLGRKGWVSAKFERGQHVPLEMLQKWILESYRAVAPKKMAALLAGGGAEKPVAQKATAKKPSAEKPATKKATAKKPVTKKAMPKRR